MHIWGQVKPVDILAIGAHPDDVELSCSGTLLRHVAQGKTFGVLDLTEGELGTRGSRAIRQREAFDAAEFMGASFRVILDLGDGFFERNEASIMAMLPVIRESRPRLVLANALRDRHPDHGRGAKLASDACFSSGLQKVETEWEGRVQERWRPSLVLHYNQDFYRKPDVLVDVTDFHEQKMQAILKFRSQFYDPDSPEPDSPISGEDFLEYMAAKSRVMGRYLMVPYAEGFEAERPFGVEDLTGLL